MRKYQYFMAIWFLATVGAYALALGHGAEQKTALMIALAGTVAVASVVAVASALTVAGALTVAVVGIGVGALALAGAVVGAVAGAVVFAGALALTGAVAFAGAGAKELRLKFRWVLAANLTTLASTVVAFSTTNLTLVLWATVAGVALLLMVGNLPKSELEVAKKPQPSAT